MSFTFVNSTKEGHICRPPSSCSRFLSGGAFMRFYACQLEKGWGGDRFLETSAAWKVWRATDHNHSGGWGSRHAEQGNRGVDIGLREEETRGGRKKKDIGRAESFQEEKDNREADHGQERNSRILFYSAFVTGGPGTHSFLFWSFYMHILILILCTIDLSVHCFSCWWPR